MKNLILILALTIGAFNVSYSQNENEVINELEYEIDNIQYDAKFLSTYKTGDDDSQLRGNLKNIFSDSLVGHEYLIQNSRFYGLSVTDNTLTTIIPFTEWIESINVNAYPTDEYRFEYISYDNSESLSIYNKSGSIIRTIYVYWDNTYNGTEYTNIRSITDTSL